MKGRKIIRKKQMIVVTAFLATFLFAGQLLAATAWSAEAANAGPTIAIVKLMRDNNVDWATEDIITRLNSFVSDDAWFKDRITVYETDDPSIVLDLNSDIVIYVSHGGPQHIVTGDHLTSWKEMASIVEASPAILHQFAVCYSSEIIQYGNEDSAQYVYAVSGQRPAQVIDIDVVSNVMLALGHNEKDVEEYRTEELIDVKRKLSRGQSPFYLSFNYVTFDIYHEGNTEYFEVTENEGVDNDYWWILENLDLSATPYDIKYWVGYYWGAWINEYNEPEARPLQTAVIDYNKTYSNWTVWGVPGPVRFVVGTYSGFITVQNLGIIYVSAGGEVEGEVEWMEFNHQGIGNLRVQMKKVDGEWQRKIDRHLGNTGNAWTDYCFSPSLEYDSNWSAIPGFSGSSGVLASKGNSYTIESIPTGTSWHGPSFVRPLPFAFKLSELGCFRADLGLTHYGQSGPLAYNAVALYDSNGKVALSLAVADMWSGSAKENFYLRYYDETGSVVDVDAIDVTGDYIYGDKNCTLQIFYDPDSGLRASLMGTGGWSFISRHDLNLDRELKYIAIQSYRYSSTAEHHDIIANISVSCVSTEYSVFHWDCQTELGWIKQGTDTTFENLYELNDSGTLHSTGGYLWADGIPNGSGWKWGPLFVQEIPMSTSIENIQEFSADIEFLYNNYYAMGDLSVILYDEDKEIIERFTAYDSYYGTSTRRYLTYYKSPTEGGGGDTWFEASCSGSWRATFSLWYDQPSGSIMTKVDDGSPLAHTHYTAGNYDPTRKVKYVGIQIVSCRTYAQNGQDLRLHSMTLECTPYRNTWYDGCDSVDGWRRYGSGSGFEALRELHDSGTLYSTNGYLYADDISTGSSWKWGPVFVKEIPGATTVGNIRMLEAQIEFSYVSSRMGDLIVMLFDENKERITSFVGYDSWYGTKTNRYVRYDKAAYEGDGAEQWLESTQSSSWTATFRFWYDPSSSAVKSQVDDGSPLTHTHYDGSSFDRERVVRYIGVQFARAQSYTYNGQNMRLHYLKMTYDRIDKEFNDPCETTDDWIPDATWPNTVWDTSGGSLYTNGGYLWSSGFSEYNKGPFFYKELSSSGYVNQFDELSVKIENPLSNSVGGFAFCLYDSQKEIAARIRFIDSGTSGDGAIDFRWHQENGEYTTVYNYNPGQTWDFNLRLYNNDDDEFVAEIPGIGSTVLLSGEDYMMESGRYLQYIGIQWLYLGTPYNQIRLKDTALLISEQMQTPSDDYLPKQEDPLEDPVFSPLNIPQDMNEAVTPPVTVEFILAGGWWPTWLVSIHFLWSGIVDVVFTFSVDILLSIQPYDFRMEHIPGTMTLSEREQVDSIWDCLMEFMQEEWQELIAWNVACILASEAAKIAIAVGNLLAAGILCVAWSVLFYTHMCLIIQSLAHHLGEWFHETGNDGSPLVGFAVFVFILWLGIVELYHGILDLAVKRLTKVTEHLADNKVVNFLKWGDSVDIDDVETGTLFYLIALYFNFALLVCLAFTFGIAASVPST
ncbi:MAG: hypothetical protein ACW98Y_09850 [Candidatus Thorarchaeota archaeon]|jgi:hypothetical protein